MCGTQEGFPPGLHDKLDQRLKDPSLTRGDCVRMQIESIQLCFPEKCLKPLTSGWAGKTKVSLPPPPPPRTLPIEQMDKLRSGSLMLSKKT